MNHEYFALQFHYARAAELQEEARQDSVARRVLRAKRALAQMTAPTKLHSLPTRERVSAGTPEEKEAA